MHRWWRRAQQMIWERSLQISKRSHRSVCSNHRPYDSLTRRWPGVRTLIREWRFEYTQSATDEVCCRWDTAWEIVKAIDSPNFGIGRFTCHVAYTSLEIMLIGSVFQFWIPTRYVCCGSMQDFRFCTDELDERSWAACGEIPRHPTCETRTRIRSSPIV